MSKILHSQQPVLVGTFYFTATSEGRMPSHPLKHNRTLNTILIFCEKNWLNLSWQTFIVLKWKIRQGIHDEFYYEIPDCIPESVKKNLLHELKWRYGQF